MKYRCRICYKTIEVFNPILKFTNKVIECDKSGNPILCCGKQPEQLFERKFKCVNDDCIDVEKIITEHILKSEFTEIFHCEKCEKMLIPVSNNIELNYQRWNMLPSEDKKEKILTEQKRKKKMFDVDEQIKNNKLKALAGQLKENIKNRSKS